MSRWLLRLPFGIFLVVAAAALARAAMPHGMNEHPRASRTSSFMAENAQAMDRMMAAMTITPSGNVDRDFVAMMVPHHQGAIDMALAELKYGKDETLRRMAQEIIVEQQQEIAAMHLAADKLTDARPASSIAFDVCTTRPTAPRRMHSPPMQGDL